MDASFCPPKGQRSYPQLRQGCARAPAQKKGSNGGSRSKTLGSPSLVSLVRTAPQKTYPKSHSNLGARENAHRSRVHLKNVCVLWWRFRRVCFCARAPVPSPGDSDPRGTPAKLFCCCCLNFFPGFHVFFLESCIGILDCRNFWSRGSVRFCFLLIYESITHRSHRECGFVFRMDLPFNSWISL